MGCIEHPKKQHLAYMDVGDFTCNKNFVIESIKKTLKVLKSSFNHLKLVVSDSVSYNISAKTEIQNQYPHIKWVTCFSHLMHNCCTNIMKRYENISQFIIYMNDMIYSSSRFHYMFNRLPKPPEVIATRWGSFLNAIAFYVKYYEHCKEHILKKILKQHPIEINF